MASYADVTRFWREAGPDRWFKKDDHFDVDFRARFLDDHFACAERRHDDWLDHAEGALALMILLDQFPRNAFRGTAHMFATDPLALSFARKAIAAGHDEATDDALRIFLYLPFMHAETIAEQEDCVRLCRHSAPEQLKFAEEHRDIIARFGRFPHRNRVLGRDTTAEEQAYLSAGGFTG